MKKVKFKSNDIPLSLFFLKKEDISINTELKSMKYENTLYSKDINNTKFSAYIRYKTI